MQNKIVIGVDIGGTSISAASIINNKLVKKSTAETGNDRPFSKILETLFEVIDKVYLENTQAIGIGVPGFVDNETGIIKLINNIPSFNGLNLKEKVEAHYNIPVKVNNDANCFALGSHFFGTQSLCNSVVGITLGTGLGGGIVINNKLHSGVYGGAGEFGCMPYLDGSFEDYCSSKFFALKYDTNGKDLFIRARNGDVDALDIFEEFGSHLGKLILQILFVLSPEKVVIGGNIAKSHAYFMGSLRMAIEDYPVDIIRENFKVEITDLEFPGIYGAAALCLS